MSMEVDGAYEAAEDLPRKKFSGKKLVLYIVLPLLLLLAAGLGLYFSGVLDAMTGAPEEPEVAEVVPQEEEKVLFYEVPDMLVNLNVPGNRSRYLKMKIAIQVSRDSDMEALDLVMPRIVDNFQVYLRELRLDELRGSAGMYRLREELMMRVAAAAHPTEIKDVLFQEILIQ